MFANVILHVFLARKSLGTILTPENNIIFFFKPYKFTIKTGEMYPCRRVVTSISTLSLNDLKKDLYAVYELRT